MTLALPGLGATGKGFGTLTKTQICPFLSSVLLDKSLNLLQTQGQLGYENDACQQDSCKGRDNPHLTHSTHSVSPGYDYYYFCKRGRLLKGHTSSLPVAAETASC